jgi:two-component system response regulator
MEKSRTILLIEDDEAHAALITRILEGVNPGAEIRLAYDGEEAIEYLFQQGKYADPELSQRPALVLLDLRLPRVDGQEVLKAIKQSEALKAIPVVVLTSSESEYDVDTAYRNHANSYLVKPLGFDEFSVLLQELSTYWLLKNRLSGK